MNTFFVLCEWGLGVKSAMSIFNAGIYYQDYLYNGKDCFKNIYKKETIIQIIEGLSDEQIRKGSVYDLLTVGISLTLINKCLDLKISLDDLRGDDSNKYINLLGVSTYSKIKMGIRKLDERILDTKNFTFNCLVNFLKFSTKSLGEIKNHFLSLEEYPYDKLEPDMEALKNDGLISIVDDQVAISYSSLDEVLSSLRDEIKLIMSEKFQGKSLEQIGKMINNTRESVRQKIELSFAGFPTLKEDRYKDAFMKYNWDYESFNFFFHENKTVYEYLKYRYGCGKTGLYALLSENLTSEQRDYLFTHHNLVTIDDTILSAKRDTILKHLMCEVCKDKPIKTQELFDLFSESLAKLDLGIENWKNVHVFSNYLDSCPFAICSGNDEVRYYFFARLSDIDVFNITSLLQLPDGYYSAQILFKYNQIMMKKYNIQNEYELHNFLRRMDNHENVTFKKMPNFITGNISRDDFIYEKIVRLAPISNEDFLKYLEDNYGHKTKSFELQLRKYNFDKKTQMLLPNAHALMGEELDFVLSCLKGDIILCSNFYKEIEQRLGRSTIYSITKKIINNNGYYLYRGAYFVKNEISDPIQHIKNEILASDIYHLDIDKYRDFASLYFEALEILKSEHQIVCSEPLVYYTKNYIDSLGVNEEMVESFVSEVKNLANEINFVTMDKVRKALPSNPFIKMNFSDMFYESVLIQSGLFFYLGTKKLVVFTSKDKVPNVNDYVKLMSKEVSKFSVLELSKLLLELYDIEITPEHIQLIMFENEFSQEIIDKYLDK